MPDLMRDAVRTGLDPRNGKRANAARRLRGARLGPVAAAVPPEALGNAGIAAHLTVSEEWIVARTGVRERRVAAPEQRLVDYATEAAAGALARAELDPGALELVLVATSSHDQLTPAAAPVVGARIGATPAAAFDLNAACSGFVTAVATATAMIEAGRAANAVVVGADLLHRHSDPDDRATAALFGDGAGAVVVEATDAPGRVGPFVLGADGKHADLVFADRDEGLIRMRGQDTFRHAVARLSESTSEAVGQAGIGLDDIDLFVFHQANSRILRAVGERLRLPEQRVIDCVDRYGNTSAASIPIALLEAEAEGRLRPDSTVLMGAFGAGLTWAATVVEWGSGR
jgi:3-oxoacyl-[acyl-carrier-protein] synthase III